MNNPETIIHPPVMVPGLHSLHSVFLPPEISGIDGAFKGKGGLLTTVVLTYRWSP